MKQRQRLTSFPSASSLLAFTLMDLFPQSRMFQVVLSGQLGRGGRRVGGQGGRKLSCSSAQLSRKTRPQQIRISSSGCWWDHHYHAVGHASRSCWGLVGWGDVNSNQTPKITGSLCTSHQCIFLFGPSLQVFLRAAGSVHTVSQSADLHAAGTPVTFVC